MTQTLVSPWLSLDYARHVVAVRVTPKAMPALAPMWRFLSPHVAVTPSSRAPDAAAVVEFRPFADWEGLDEQTSEPTLVRKSRTRANHVWGRRWRRASRTIIHVPSSDTVFDLADDHAHAVVYVSEGSWYHASDFVRDLVWELAAASGTFLHAAAVSDGHGLVAFIGGKGAGKTTTAIEFMRAGADFFTGDALYLPNGENECYGFPDHPNVGWGTLRENEELLAAAAAAGLTPAADHAKVLLPHDVYETALHSRPAPPPLPLRAVVLPEVHAGGVARIESTTEPGDLEQARRHTTDDDEGWESFVRRFRPGTPTTASLTLRDVAWFVRLGSGRLPEEHIHAVLGVPSASSHQPTLP